MNALLDDIMDLIVANTSFVKGTTLWAGREPASPSNIVTLYDAPDAGPWLPMDENTDGNPIRYDYTAFQTLIRNTSYTEAVGIGDQLIDVLHARGNFVHKGTWYSLIQAMDTPFLLEWDDNNRVKVVVNFHVQRTPE